MEIFALIMFVVLTAIGIPLAGASAMGAPLLGVQGVAAIGGLVLCIVFIARDGGQLLAWAAFGLSVAGALSTMAGVAWLTADDRDVSWAGQSAEEHASTWPASSCRCS
jgi:hypothetical protein